VDEENADRIQCSLCSFSKETASPAFITIKDASNIPVPISGYNRQYEGFLTIAADKDGTFYAGTGEADVKTVAFLSHSFPRGDVNCQVENLDIREPITIEKDQIFQIGSNKIVALNWPFPADYFTPDKVTPVANPITVNDGGTIRFSRRPFVKATPSTEPAGG
jgi:hypothetical protein